MSDIKDVNEKFHKPVLVKEVIDALNLGELAHLKSQGTFIDATIGTGGHAIEIVKRNHFVLGIDADKRMLRIAERRLKQAINGLACPDEHRVVPVSDHKKYSLVCGNFKDLAKIAKENAIDKVDGILFDLGISTPQIKSKLRGFSFANPKAKLDLRIDKENQNLKGYDVLNFLRYDQLVKLFYQVLDKKTSSELSKGIIKQRLNKRIETVGDFVNLINKFGGKSQVIRKKKNLNPATLPLLALRIAVNSELENLKIALIEACRLLKSGGRLVVISFHSGEDLIVKNMFKQSANNQYAKLVNKKPIIPEFYEIETNPSARSAKLRILERI